MSEASTSSHPPLYYWDLRALSWSLLSLRGAARSAFLQRLLTLDLRQLSPGECQRAFLLDHRGRCESAIYLSAPHVGAEALGHLALCPPEQERALIEALDRYHFGEDISWAPAPLALFCFHSAAALRVAQLISEESWAALKLTAPLFGPESLTLALSPEEAERLTERCEEAGFMLGSQSEWEALRLSCGYPEAPSEYHRQHSPLDWGMAGISEGKGCYPGQEVIERSIALGRAARRPAHLWVPGFPEGHPIPEVGAPIFGAQGEGEARPVGTVSSAARAGGALHLLASLKRSAEAPLSLAQGTFSEPLQLLEVPMHH